MWAGRVRAVDVVDQALARVAEVDARLHAFTDVWSRRARDAATAVDAPDRGG
jgi:Asp-tRNA(Asn)/Glu-tRNA(Gln) amidotransferase A subunit family amidase